MPRVTEEYLAGRRAEILAASARRFAADGFHATSMAGIISESGLSAGAVYRYFRSKEELISAVAEIALSKAKEVFDGLLVDGASPSPAEAVSAMVRGVVARAADDTITKTDLTRLAVQVWGEALSNPEVHQRVGDVYRSLRGHCAEVARRWQAAGHLPPDVLPEQVGTAMLGLVQGFVLQRLLLEETSADAYLAGATALLPGSD
ncbi:AcrR family transcriptional regulator [Actinoplanes lutulentus]|uniref:TetR family transcriptional regulator n=1 Tax=Actinoplanes lutulentus TaxID=1287878 RepID=A0A327Z243_9ACTN|nr:TetR/AcrR family transcriptional regulator [Actinoplanes lutulentus]MBB2940337.1 AcrR family transcriptional regulator [Actinoplanes lutulentus]RAK28830.1 TetR family transcriptional regulator [Actinoplanes lutulentus]